MLFVQLNPKCSLLTKLAVALVTLVTSHAALAQSPSHSYINLTRSSSVSHYYVGIGVEGEYGLMNVQKGADSNDTGKRASAKTEDGDSNVEEWKGYGIRNEIGVEFLKFLQFNIGHSSLNLRSKEDATERLAGSRMEAGGRLNFYAPLGNLQMGGGLTMLRLDYAQQDQTSDFYGSGYYYTLGYDYFLSQNISFFAKGRRNEEHLVRNSGSDVVKSMKSSTTGFGLGFNIWL